MAFQTVVALTAGDVAGIGPEVVVRSLTDEHVRNSCLPLLIGHPQIFRDAAMLAGQTLALGEIQQLPVSSAEFRRLIAEMATSGKVACWNPAGDSVLSAPQRSLSAAAGDGAFHYLTSAIELALSGGIDAITTAPLNKESLHLAGFHYPGHTEILAEHCGVRDFAMMLHLPESAVGPWRSILSMDRAEAGHGIARDGLSIAHVTLHTSVASVPGLLSEASIVKKVSLMADFLKSIQCQRQAIAVCALNPHGGENGLFGDEELRIIQPAVRRCQARFPNISGPLPVDTLIRRAVLGEFDGVIAMYHDQGHIPIKLIGFDSAVNITLGLPIVRTSPTHGTAFDRAWNSSTPANASGMIEAVKTAVLLARAHASVSALTKAIP